MQIHTPDPAHTGSVHVRAHFRLALKLSLGFVAVLWLIMLRHRDIPPRVRYSWEVEGEEAEYGALRDEEPPLRH